ncbi:Uncharacterised protein [Mycoplasmopsis maculosa]|uniref:Uncharacterized protein n=2 Tax=Mycoplasmopsis maculosa TaxID=114885 RepID=A0A449B583_9BACT|nr:Uncharacterised protein [Mycoplasmopsis maculosa]
MNEYDTEIKNNDPLTFYYELSLTKANNKHLQRDFKDLIVSLIQNKKILNKHKYWRNIWSEVKVLWKDLTIKSNKNGLKIDINKFISFIKKEYLLKVIDSVSIDYEYSKFDENLILIYVNNAFKNKNEFFDVFYSHPVKLFKFNMTELEIYIRKINLIFKNINSKILELTLTLINKEIASNLDKKGIKTHFTVNQLIPNWYGRIMRRELYKI